MKRLQTDRLHVTFSDDTPQDRMILPRRYTLTHSDMTGELFLTIGKDYDYRKLSRLYTRFMRDEVCAEWIECDGSMKLHVHCHVSGGIVFGSSSFRDAIFRRELPLVLEAFRYGDRVLFEVNPGLDNAPIEVIFSSRNRRFNTTEMWGVPADFR